MKKIIDYKVVSSDGEHSLEDMVIAGIKNGWQPLGGICTTNNEPSLIGLFAQAMVAYEESDT